jgi:hypothetical protein
MPSYAASLSGTWSESTRRIITDGVEQEVFRPVDATVTAMAILGALNWTVKWYRQDGRRSSQEIGREFADLLVRGLLAPGVELAAESADG